MPPLPWCSLLAASARPRPPTRSILLKTSRRGTSSARCLSGNGRPSLTPGSNAPPEPRMVCHRERRARHRHALVAARARWVHLAAGDAFKVRERGVAVRAGFEPRVRHGGSSRRQISCSPHPTQNTERWRRDTACCSVLHVRRGMSRFTTRPHCGQPTGELARRRFMLSQAIGDLRRSLAKPTNA